jgi:hypothetical protein
MDVVNGFFAMGAVGVLLAWFLVVFGRSVTALLASAFNRAW